MGDRLLPILLLFSLALPIEGVAEVVVGLGLEIGVVGGHRPGKGVERLVVLLAHVSTGPGVELEAALVRGFFRQRLERLVGLVVLPGLVEIHGALTGGGGGGRSRSILRAEGSRQEDG